MRSALAASSSLCNLSFGEKKTLTNRKIPKIIPGAYLFLRPFLRGLSMEGILRFKIDWASLIVGRKFTLFALFYFVFEDNFRAQSPPGGLYLEGRFNRGFFALRVWGGLYLEGLLHGGAYFRNFTVLNCSVLKKGPFLESSRNYQARKYVLLTLKTEGSIGLQMIWQYYSLFKKTKWTVFFK